MFADELGETQQDLLFLGRIGVAPNAALERLARGMNRTVDIGRAAIGDMSEDLASIGETLAKVAPSAAATYAPPMKARPSILSAAARASQPSRVVGRSSIRFQTFFG